MEFALPVAFALLFHPLRRSRVGAEGFDHLLVRLARPAHLNAQSEGGTAARCVARFVVTVALRLPSEVRPEFFDQPPKIRDGNGVQLPHFSQAPRGDGEISTVYEHLDRRRVRAAASLERPAGLPPQQRLHRRQVGREREYLGARPGW
jgi:hypothetical protein